MARGAGNTFIFNIDRVELADYSGYTDNNSILYNIRVWDYQNNSAATPKSGNYLIKVEELEDTNGKTDDKKETEGFTQSLLMYIILLIVIVVVVGVVLFLFIKKSKEDIDEDRHKLRMAIADVHEGAVSADKPLAAPPSGIAPMADYQTAQLPSADDRTQTLGYLPEASSEPVMPSSDYSGLQQSGTPSEKQLATELEKPDTPTVSEPADDSAKTTKTQPKVEIADGLAVSLPDDGAEQ
jgi:hypothetical protein